MIYSSKHFSKAIVSISLAFASLGTLAGSDDSHPYLTASQSLTASAEVVSVDLETRRIELKRESGLVLPYRVAETAYNLDQVEVGDVLDYRFESRISLILVGEADALPKVMEQVSQNRAKPGEMPWSTTETLSVQTAKIVSINLEAHAFQLEWPDGSIEDYTTEEAQILQKASVGDHLVKTQSERLVLSVSRPGKD